MRLHDYVTHADAVIMATSKYELKMNMDLR